MINIPLSQMKADIGVTEETKAPAPPKMLEEALELIHGAREGDYGTPTENFTRIARLWSVILEQDVTTSQVALCMIAVKMSRAIKSPHHRDSWVDMAGYIGCKDRISRGE